jgi:copper chaperone
VQQVFKVPEVSCGHCKSAIEGALGTLSGVEESVVDIEGRVVSVDFDEAVVDRTAVVRAIESAGYSVAG